MLRGQGRGSDVKKSGGEVNWVQHELDLGPLAKTGHARVVSGASGPSQRVRRQEVKFGCFVLKLNDETLHLHQVNQVSKLNSVS